MGGPIKPFLWCLAFDPVVTAVRPATLAPVPTYVDETKPCLSPPYAGSGGPAWSCFPPAGLPGWFSSCASAAGPLP
eukprot:5921050-Alexandrium_andersonii.AAC.1